MNYVVDFMTGEIDARSTGFPLGIRLVRKAEKHLSQNIASLLEPGSAS
jgi:hypothetical protein